MTNNNSPRLNTYDSYADEYARSMQRTEENRFALNHDLVIPALLRIAGDVRDLRVLDAGCGDGIVTRMLAARGAISVGIDVSQRLVELAQQQNAAGDIQYVAANLSEPLPRFRQSFDLIVSNLVLNDVPDYQGFAATLGNSARPGGRLVLSLTNPYSAVMREKVVSYFDSGTATLYNWPGVQIYHYHRTVQDYLTAFRAAGCLLDGYHDLQIPEEMLAAAPAANRLLPWFDMYARFPFFLIWEFTKAA